jgi:hypothetical protein
MCYYVLVAAAASFNTHVNAIDTSIHAAVDSICYHYCTAANAAINQLSLCQHHDLTVTSTTVSVPLLAEITY